MGTSRLAHSHADAARSEGGGGPPSSSIYLLQLHVGPEDGPKPGLSFISDPSGDPFPGSGASSRLQESVQRGQESIQAGRSSLKVTDLYGWHLKVRWEVDIS